MIKKIFYFFYFVCFSTILFTKVVADSNGQHNIQAVNMLSQNKSVETTNTLIEMLSQEEHSSEVSVQVINALSERANKKVKNKILEAISNVVMETKDNVVAYSGLLAMARIGDYKSQYVIDTFLYCLKNRMDDPYIADIINILKNKFPKDKL